MSDTKGFTYGEPNTYGGQYNQPPPAYGGQYNQPPPAYEDPNSGYAPPPNTGYAPPPNAGYAQPPNTGYASPPNTGYAAPVMINIPLGPRPVTLQCPHCHSTIETRTRSEAGEKAWLFGMILCVVG